MSINNRYENETKELILKFPKRVDSTNSIGLDEELNKLINDSNPDKIVIDLNDVTYISSAGLRIILELSQLRKDFRVINANRDVYETLDITGLTRMLDIERQMRQYSSENWELIGRGISAVVYKIDNDTIIKKFNPDVDFTRIKRELDISKAAFTAGISTAIPYDIVKVDDCYGAMYEMIKADTVSSIISQNQNELEPLATGYGKFMREMNSVVLNKESFSSAKSKYIKYKETIAPLLDEKASKVFVELIDKIPERTTFTHGDFHPDNIMLQNGKMLLIDMGETAYGSPIIDIMVFGNMRILADLVTEDMNTPGLIGLTWENIKKIWSLFIRNYFITADNETLQKIENTCLLYSTVKTVADVYIFPIFEESFRQKVVNRMMDLYSISELNLDFLDEVTSQQS